MRRIALMLVGAVTCAMAAGGALTGCGRSMPWCTASARHDVEAAWRDAVDALGNQWTSMTSCDAGDEMIWVENAPQRDAEPRTALTARLASTLRQRGWAQGRSPDPEVARLCLVKGAGGHALYAQLFDNPVGPILRLARNPSGTRGYC